MSAVADYVMPEAEAERLTNRITLIAGTVREGMEKLYSLVDEAKRGNAHVALGYPSWTAYLADTLGKTPLRLEREERREVVGYLAGEGMSTRAIAPIVGASKDTVHRDLSGVSSETPASVETVPSFDPAAPWDGEQVTARAIQAARAVAVEPAHVDKETGEIHDAPVQKITGRDGKTYTRPEPRPSATRTEPKRGTDLHALRYVILPALDAWADMWTNKPLLDDTVTAEEAAQILRDLSRTTPVLSQIRRLLNSRTGV